MTPEQKKNLTDQHQVSFYYEDDVFNRVVMFNRELAVLCPNEPGGVFTEAAFARAALNERLDRGVQAAAEKLQRERP